MMKEVEKSQPIPHKGKGKARSKFDFRFRFPYEIESWYPLLLIVMTLGVFWQSVYMEFTYDDHLVVLEDPRIWKRDFVALWIQNNQIVLGHPVRTFSYMVDNALFEFSPAGYHLHNLFWHTLCVVLFFVLLKKLTHHPTFSLFGALIFAIHPIHVEAVTNITNRKELLALGFLLIAFLSYTQFLERKTGRKWAWFFGSGGILGG